MATKIALVLVALCAVIFTCNAASVQKRDTEQGNLVSDANVALDKIFQDVKKGMNQLSADGINFEEIMKNIASKATELGEHAKKLGTDLGQKMSEAAKEQGITS